MLHRARFRVMGTTAEVLLHSHDDDTSYAERRLRELESRWTRFRDDSELSLVNAAGGAPCVVSDDTAVLVEHLSRAWRETGGVFDPTMPDTLSDLGYARSWPDTDTSVASTRNRAARGCRGIEVDRSARIVRLPAGLHLDPGGLGKGLAADLVSTELLDRGALGALVNVGGDLRAVGRPPEGDAWSVDVEHPTRPDRPVARVALAYGGVATTSRCRHRWRASGMDLHHVLDPVDGRPADRPWATVTVVAATGWWAEALAKRAFVVGDLDRPDAAALFVDEDGRTRVAGRDAATWFAPVEGVAA
jgi:thiamine biosynthesis lipoprotein